MKEFAQFTSEDYYIEQTHKAKITFLQQLFKEVYMQQFFISNIQNKL